MRQRCYARKRERPNHLCRKTFLVESSPSIIGATDKRGPVEISVARGLETALMGFGCRGSNCVPTATS